jgi:predicted metallopeptidase
MKLHYVRYLEARDGLQVASDATMVFTLSFAAGCRVARNTGHGTKAKAMARIDAVNAAAGKTIAEYAGRIEPPKGWEGYELTKEAA